MACHNLIAILLFLYRIHMLLCNPITAEPVCTSRYDFESRLLKDIIELKFEMNVLKERYSNDVSKLKVQLKNSEKQMEEIREAAVKPPVAFLVRTLSDTTSGANKTLKFTATVYDTDNTFDHDSGYFTAPVDGTYVFNLQLCTRLNKYIHAQIFANTYMIANSILYDADGYSCSTVATIAVLSGGDRVCAKLGVEYDSGDIIFQHDDNRWAAFMGTLVN